MSSTTRSAFSDPALLRQGLVDSVKKLDPRHQLRNPVMFVVWLGAAATTVVTFREPGSFNIQLTFWLWFTLIFANFAEAVAEGRGKAQAASLRKLRTTTLARRLLADESEERVAATELRKGDRVVCETGDIIPTGRRRDRGNCHGG